jgi:ribosomal protein S18 acetylase RimI-like enzyme
MAAPAKEVSTLRIVPANEASWHDVQTVFGTRGDASRCRCQWYKMRASEWDRVVSVEERTERLREQTGCGHPDRTTTSGLVAYLGNEPVGWCAVEPRTAYVRLRTKPMIWAGRAEDKDDDGVWSVTCFTVRVGYRRRGISDALARAAVHFAREHGARSVEGYPLITDPGRVVPWGELFVGSVGVFARAGFREVSRPTPRRAVMRIDF